MIYMGKTPRIKSTILGISIAIILALFIGYGISTFYKEPKYDDFCDDKLSFVQVDNEVDCLSIGGQWTATPIPQSIEKDGIVKKGYCDAQYTCREEYGVEREIYNRNVFIF